MRIYTVAVPDELCELSERIENISLEKNQSFSKTIRDVLLESFNISNTDRVVQTRNMYKNRSRKA